MRLQLVDGTVDLDRFQVERGGEIVHITKAEAAILRYLVDRAGNVVPRADVERDVLGYGPGVETRALDTLMYKLRHKIERDAKNPDHVVSVRGVGYRYEGALPERRAELVARPPFALVGRDALVRALEDHLEATRWVTLVGGGGTGKTRIAAELARRVEASGREVLAVDLGEAGDSGSLAHRLGLALGARSPGEDPPYGRELVARGQTLLWIDAVELAAPVGALVQAWRRAAPELRMLVSTRTRLHQAGEAVVDVPPLDSSAARQLFTERARQARFDVALPDDEASWAPVLGALDGHPLAIELAALRLRALDFPTLVRRVLEAPHRLDASEGAPFPSRHVSLERVLGDAWTALGNELRSFLEQAAHFRTPFPLEAAEACLQVVGPRSVLDALEDLVDLGLVRVLPGPALRYALPASIRAFALEQARPDDPARARIRRWWIEQCPAIAADGSGEPNPRLVRAADDLREGFFASLAEGSLPDALRLYHGLVACLHENDPLDVLGTLEARLLAHPALDAVGKVELLIDRAVVHSGHDRRDAAMALLEQAGGAASTPGQQVRAVVGAALVTPRGSARETLATRAVEIAVAHGDPRLEATARSVLASVHRVAGRLAAAEEQLVAASRQIALLDAPWLLARVENQWATLCLARGDYALARSHAERGLAAARPFDLPFELAAHHLRAAEISLGLHDLDRAAREAEEGLAFADRGASSEPKAFAHQVLGQIALRRGELDDSDRELREAFEIARRRELGVAMRDAASALAGACLDRGDADQAMAWLERATSVSPALTPETLAVRAHALAILGDPQAPVAAEAAEAAARGLSNPLRAVDTEVRAGLAWVALGDLSRAKRTLARARTLVPTHPWAEQLRARLEQAVVVASAQ